MLKSSFVTVDITPQKPVFQAGFASRTHQSEGVDDPIFLKCALLRANTSLLMITIDAVGADRGFVDGMKDALQASFGFKADEIIINFSHTHSSVYLTGEDPNKRPRQNYSMAQVRWHKFDEPHDFTEDVKWFHWLREQTIAAVAQCFETLKDSLISVAKGTSDAGISRRVPTPTGTLFKPNPNAKIDKDLFVIKLSAPDGALQGILFNYACHPTMKNDYRISGDFVGHTCSVLEATYPGSTVLFLQGCAADIRASRTSDGENFMKCGLHEVHEAGEALAADVRRVIEEDEFKQIDCQFSTYLTDVQLFTNPVKLEEIQKIAASEEQDSYRTQGALRTLRAIDSGTARSTVQHYIVGWHLDATTRIIAMEGEVVSGYSLMIKRLFAEGQTITLGYSNGLNTYIPTRQVLLEGGYEAEIFLLHGIVGPFAPETEDIILGAIVREELLS